MNHGSHRWRCCACRESNGATNGTTWRDRDENSPITKLFSFFSISFKKKRKERLSFRQHEPRHRALATYPYKHKININK